MFADNLIRLRKLQKITQEELAERIGVSRQTIAKWESGESYPDLDRGGALAEVFGVSLDELVRNEELPKGLPVPLRGKHIFGSVKVGEKGQIVIPARAREIFDIRPGDSIIVLGDESRGMALLNERHFFRLVEEVKKCRDAEK